MSLPFPLARSADTSRKNASHHLNPSLRSEARVVAPVVLSVTRRRSMPPSIASSNLYSSCLQKLLRRSLSMLDFASRYAARSAWLALRILCMLPGARPQMADMARNVLDVDVLDTNASIATSSSSLNASSMYSGLGTCP